MKTPDIFFPQLNVALVVRKHCPKGGRLVTSWGDQKVYLVETSTCPRGARVAEKLLGGWNYFSGECISLVYARRFSSLTLFCERDAADKLVKTRQLENGMFVNLVRIQTRMFMSIGCTPIFAEQELAEDEAE
jgi:hypothetical protein